VTPDPTLPRRPWEIGQRELVIDRNGVSRAVYKNANPQLDDKMRHQREQNATNAMAKTRSEGFVDDTGGSAAVPGSPGTMPAEQPARVKPDTGEWLQAIVQRYSQEMPMGLTLDKNAQPVTPDMLMPTEQQLAQMDEETREGIGRVLLALITKYYGDNTLKQGMLYGSRISNYVPGKMVSYWRWIVGRK